MISPAAQGRLGRVAGTLALLTLLGALTLVLQMRSGAFDRELAGYPDEAAHYVTGLMLYDYVTHGSGQPPMEYALDYYLHYPKVALGHWPPFFYVVQAAWMMLFTSSKTSVLLLMGVLTTVTAYVIYRRGSRESGSLAGVAAAAAYVALPVVQEHTSMVMAEGLLTLLCLLAALEIGNFVESGRARHCAWFALWTSLAILTKGNGWALLMAPPAAFALSGRWDLFQRRAFQAAGAAVLAACAPWQLATMHMAVQGWHDAPGIGYTAKALPAFVLRFAEMAGSGVLLLAVAGVGAIMAARFRGRRPDGETAALVALAAAMLLFHSVAPAGVETRKLMPAAPALLLLAMRGGRTLLRAAGAGRAAPAAAAGTVLVLFAAQAFTLPAKPARGMAQTAATMAKTPKGTVMLVASDANGEGAFISEMAMRDARPDHYVLRASKLLGDESWGGDVYRPRYIEPAALLRALDEVPVDVVVIDNWQGLRERPHQAMLRRALAGGRAGWTREESPGIPPYIEVFRRISPQAPRGTLKLTAESMLYRVLGRTPRTD